MGGLNCAYTYNPWQMQVLVEMGSSLQMGAAMHRVQDIALESVALHTVRAGLAWGHQRWRVGWCAGWCEGNTQ